MPDKIRVCPHCNNQMRRWKEGDYLPDFAEVDAAGKPVREWWMCPVVGGGYVQTFYDENTRPTGKFIGRWRDKKGVWHNVLNWDLERAATDRQFEAAFFKTEDEARQKVHGWADARPKEVDLVSIEEAYQ